MFTLPKMSFFIFRHIQNLSQIWIAHPISVCVDLIFAYLMCTRSGGGMRVFHLYSLYLFIKGTWAQPVRVHFWGIGRDPGPACQMYYLLVSGEMNLTRSYLLVPWVHTSSGPSSMTGSIVGNRWMDRGGISSRLGEPDIIVSWFHIVTIRWNLFLVFDFP